MGRESMVRGGSGKVRKDALRTDRGSVLPGRLEEGISESLLKSEQELGKQRPRVGEMGCSGEVGTGEVCCRQREG